MRRLLPILLFLNLLRPAMADEVAIVHAVIHPVSGPAIVDGTLVARDGRIVSVGSGPPPAGAAVVDARGLHLYPSLIDPDTSLGLVEIDAVLATRDDVEKGRVNANARADLAFNPDSQLLPVTMSGGILVAGVTPRGALVAGRTAVMRLHGWTREDMTIKAPAAVYVQWPRETIDRRPAARPIKKQEKARREALRELDEAFENARAYEKARKAGRADERDVQWEALAAAVSGEIPVMVAADGLDEIRAALAWCKRQKLRMVLLGGRDAWRAGKEIAAAHVPVIFTALLTVPSRDSEPYDAYYRAPGLLVRDGVAVSLSRGGAAADVRQLPDLGGRARAWGLSDLESLRAITLHPAEALGVSDRLGTLQPGKEATFFLADGDILDTRTHVLRAWVLGTEIDLVDRQKKLWEKYRSRPRR